MDKLREAARQVVANGVQGTYAKYYSVPPADFEALREALAEQAEQEPVGHLCEASFGRGQVFWFNKPADNTPLYATPVCTKDLTDDEIDSIWNSCGDLTLKYKFARAVIAAYKEKNK